MADREYIDLDDLAKLFDCDSVQKQKIQCIKLVREITGAGLAESKRFVENEITNAVVKRRVTTTIDKADLDTKINDWNSTKESSEIPPPMYLVGNCYKQIDGCSVMILGTAHPNTIHETVYGMGATGIVAHRYNRRDFGRCTGCTEDDPHNLVKLTKGQF